jgi:hypothetical protein
MFHRNFGNLLAHDTFPHPRQAHSLVTTVRTSDLIMAALYSSRSLSSLLLLLPHFINLVMCFLLPPIASLLVLLLLLFNLPAHLSYSTLPYPTSCSPTSPFRLIFLFVSPPSTVYFLFFGALKGTRMRWIDCYERTLVYGSLLVALKSKPL